jgi:competence protein ComEC
VPSAISLDWIPQNKFSKYIWDILTVSFAAQLGNTTASIYYFHHFPDYFITNLVIPLLSIIMILGVVVMTLAALNSILCSSQLLEQSIFE